MDFVLLPLLGQRQQERAEAVVALLVQLAPFDTVAAVRVGVDVLKLHANGRGVQLADPGPEAHALEAARIERQDPWIAPAEADAEDGAPFVEALPGEPHGALAAAASAGDRLGGRRGVVVCRWGQRAAFGLVAADEPTAG